MRRLLSLTLFTAALIGPAAAQQPQQPATPPTSEVQALYAKLSTEIDFGLKCSATIVDARQQVGQLQAALASAQEQAKKLKDKYEPEAEKK